MATDNILEDLSKQFSELQSSLECYLEPPEGLNSEIIAASKTLYDCMKTTESKILKQQKTDSVAKVPQKLLTIGFDNEQIWEEIQLQNELHLKQCRTVLKKVNAKQNNSSQEVKKNKKVTDTTNNKTVSDDNVDDDEEEMDNSSEDEMIDESDDEEENIPKKKYKSTIVDDQFFKLREMEEFLEEQDRVYTAGNPDKSDDEDDIDLFDGDMFDDNEDAEDESLMYKDFFDPPLLKEGKKDEQSTRNRKDKNTTGHVKDDQVGNTEVASDFQDIEVENDDVNNNENIEEKSAFELKQDQLKGKISRLEEANVSQKPWQLLGESSGKSRPLNSLLEEHVTFDHTSVGAPVITEQTTQTLEDLIRMRIRDQAWDDVERKEKQRIQPHEYKRAPELNMEKSKLSLAEVYEKEYLKQMDDEKEEKENEEHVEIRKLTDKLFVKLDALSNFLYTPKPPKPEIKIITNTPSLQMEEVTPLTMTEATQMAPEEIYEKKKGDVVGDGEKTKEDRNRERRTKKIKMKFASKEKERKEEMKAKTDSKSMKKKAIEQLKKGVRNTIIKEQESSKGAKGVKSSSAFFNKLQDEVQHNISKQRNGDGGEAKRKKQKTAQALKL